MSLPLKKQQTKIRQFEWYQVQTKVRELMGDLLQPFNKKQTQQAIKINQIKRNMLTMSKKLQDHDFILQRENASKPTYIEVQDKKIEEGYRCWVQLKGQNEQRIKLMEAVISVYQEKIKQLNQLEIRLDRQVSQRTQDFKKYKGHLDQTIDFMVKRQDNNFDQISQFKNTIKLTLSKIQTKMIIMDNRVKQLQDDSRRKTNQLGKIMEDNMKNNQKLIKLDLQLLGLSAKVDDRDRDSKLSQKFFMKVKQVENDLKFISNYLESYQPLYIQMAISQTLNTFVEGRSRRKLCIYQQKKYSKLHSVILVGQKTTLQQQMASYTNSIRKIINRNKKYVINLAVSQSVKYGVNVYEFRIEDMKDQQQQDGTKTVNIIIPQADIGRMVQQKWGKLQPQLRLMLKNEVEPTKSWIKQLQEQALMRSIQNDNNYNSINARTNDYQARLQLQQGHVSLQLKQLSHSTSGISLELIILKDHIKDILNFSSVINHIVIQDEIDRQGTALYALRSNKNALDSSVTPTLQLDPNCVNCQHKNSAVVNQAFKIACLAYNSSQIRIDQQLFSREQILEISTNILEKLKKKLEGITDIQKNISHVYSTTKKLAQIRRKSYSTIKDSNSNVSKEDFRPKVDSLGRVKQIQTLLPLLGATRTDRRERKKQLSMFY